MRNLIRMACLLALAAPALASCSTADQILFTADKVVNDIFSREDVNLNEKSYAAADYLVQQIKPYVSHDASISVEDLTLVNEPAVSSQLGGIVPQQVAERLRQLGYNIKPADWAEEGEFVLGGTYDRNRENVIVNLVMSKAKTDKTVGAFTFMMPMTLELKRLAEPKPRIYKVSQ